MWCNGQLNGRKLYFIKRKNYVYLSDICAACVQIYRPLPDWLVRAKQEPLRKEASQLSILCSTMQLNLCTLISFIQVYLLLKLALLHHRNRPARKNEDSILIQMVHECIFLKVEKSSMKHFGFAFKIHVLNATPKPLMFTLSTPLSQALPIKW